MRRAVHVYTTKEQHVAMTVFLRRAYVAGVIPDDVMVELDAMLLDHASNFDMDPAQVDRITNAAIDIVGDTCESDIICVGDAATIEPYDDAQGNYWVSAWVHVHAEDIKEKPRD